MDIKAHKLDEKKSVLRPSRSPKTKDIQLVALAQELAAKKLKDGTASSQLICYYLKEGSESTKLENDKLKRENELMAAKIEALQSSSHAEELYSQALEAMRNYSGNSTKDE